MRIKLFNIKYLPLILSLLFHFFIFILFIQKKDDFSQSINAYQKNQERLIKIALKDSRSNKQLSAPIISNRLTGKTDQISIPSQSSLTDSVQSNTIDLDQSPTLTNSLFIQMNLPKYPAIARNNELEGTVLVEIEFNELGNMKNITIVNSSGHQSLDNSVLDAVKNWKIHSSTKLTKIRKKFEFKLN